MFDYIIQHFLHFIKITLNSYRYCFLILFNFVSVRQQVLYPFIVTDQLGRFDVDAGVIGGGETGK